VGTNVIVILPPAGEDLPDVSNLIEFLEHGIRYSFPAAPSGTYHYGVPTAHSAPPLNEEIIAQDVWVWPAENGPVRGEAITPLYDKAVELPQRCRSIYEQLALVDALRSGRARERKLAIEELRERIGNARCSARIRLG